MANVPKGEGNLGPRAWVLGISIPPPKPKKKKKKKVRSLPKRRRTTKNTHDPRARSTAYTPPAIQIESIPDHSKDVTGQIIINDEPYEVIYLGSDE
jgi:hypothetical protein